VREGDDRTNQTDPLRADDSLGHSRPDTGHHYRVMTEYGFQQFMFDLCRNYSGSISSTHRTVKHNAAVGGASNSQHLGWKAADLVLDDYARDKAEVIRICADLGLWTLDEGDHIHIDDRYNAGGKKITV